jgi:hypothetical protein
MSNSYGSLGSASNGTGCAPTHSITPNQPRVTRGEVESALSNVRDELDRTAELVANLHSRLFPAMVPVGAEPQLVSMGNPYATELAQSIQDGAIRVNGFNRSLIDILERIQL